MCGAYGCAHRLEANRLNGVRHNPLGEVVMLHKILNKHSQNLIFNNLYAFCIMLSGT